MNFKFKKVLLLFMMLIMARFLCRYMGIISHTHGATYYLTEEDVFIRMQYHTYSRFRPHDFAFEIIIANSIADMKDSTKSTRYYYSDPSISFMYEHIYFDKLKDDEGMSYYRPVIENEKRLNVEYNNYKYPLLVLTENELVKKYNISLTSSGFTYCRLYYSYWVKGAYSSAIDREAILVDTKYLCGPRWILRPQYYFSDLFTELVR